MSTVTMRIRARRAPSETECILCVAVKDCTPKGTEDVRDTCLFFYIIGHHDEASQGGLLLCRRCIRLLEDGAHRFTTSNGGIVLDDRSANDS